MDKNTRADRSDQLLSELQKAKWDLMELSSEGANTSEKQKEVDRLTQEYQQSLP